MTYAIAYSVATMAVECMVIERNLLKPLTKKERTNAYKTSEERAVKLPGGLFKIFHIQNATNHGLDMLANKANKKDRLVENPLSFVKKYKIYLVGKEDGCRRSVRPNSKPKALRQNSNRGDVVQDIKATVFSVRTSDIGLADSNDEAISQNIGIHNIDTPSLERNTTSSRFTTNPFETPRRNPWSKEIKNTQNNVWPSSKVNVTRFPKEFTEQNDGLFQFEVKLKKGHGVPLKERDPLLPPLRRYRPRATKKYGAETRVRQLRVKRRREEGDKPDHSPSDYHTQNLGVPESLLVPPLSMGPTSALAAENGGCSSWQMDLETLEEVPTDTWAIPQSGSFNIVSTSTDVLHSIPSKIDSVLGSTVVNQDISTVAIEEIPATPTTDCAHGVAPQSVKLKLSASLIERASKAQDRRARKGVTSREERVHQLKVGMAVEETTLGSAHSGTSKQSTHPASLNKNTQFSSRQSTSPCRIDGMHYQGPSSPDNGLFGMWLGSYNSPAIFRATGLAGVFDVLFAKEPDSPMPTSISVKQNAPWWGLGNLLRDTCLALRPFDAANPSNCRTPSPSFKISITQGFAYLRSHSWS